MDFPLEKLLSAARAGGNWRLEFRPNRMEALVANEVIREISAQENRDYLDRFFASIRGSFLSFYYFLFLGFVSLMMMLGLYSVFPAIGKENFFLRLGVFALLVVVAHFVLKITSKIYFRGFGKTADVACDIDFQSLTYHGGGRRIEIPWQEVTEFRETENYFMIFAGAETQIALPKRIFGSGQKLLKFRVFCVQALENAHSNMQNRTAALRPQL